MINEYVSLGLLSYTFSVVTKKLLWDLESVSCTSSWKLVNDEKCGVIADKGLDARSVCELEEQTPQIILPIIFYHGKL